MEKHKPIKSVCCSVRGCEHHDGESHCTASEIAIGPKSAACCADTVCATFKPLEHHCE